MAGYVSQGGRRDECGGSTTPVSPSELLNRRNESQSYLVQPDGTIDGHPLSFERLQPVTRRAMSVRDISSVRA